jgi:hypothetical protein
MTAATLEALSVQIRSMEVHMRERSVPSAEVRGAGRWDASPIPKGAAANTLQ